MSMAIHPEPEGRRRRKRAGEPPLDVAIIGLAYRSSLARNPEEYWRNAPIPGGSPSPFLAGGADLDTLTEVAREALSDAGFASSHVFQSSVALVIGGEGRGLSDLLASALREGVITRTLQILSTIHPEWSAEDLRALREELTAGDGESDHRRGNAALLAERLNPRVLSSSLDLHAKAIVCLERASRVIARGGADLGLVLVIDSERSTSSHFDMRNQNESEGVTLTGVVLKRLEAAETDGDRVYAVLKRVTRGATSRQRASRSSDAIDPASPRWVGGTSPLLSAALALHHRVIPRPVEDQGGPPRPWIHGFGKRRRRAWIEDLGGDGVRCRALLEEHRRSSDGVHPGWLTTWETEAILTGAHNRRGWVQVATALLAWLDSSENRRVSLKDLAATLNRGQTGFAFRVGMVVANIDDLRERLRSTIRRLSEPGSITIRDARGTYVFDEPLAGPGRTVFLYPGEGSQYPGMLADLCLHFSEVREVLDTCDRIGIERSHRRRPSDLLFGGPVEGDSDLWSIGTAVNIVLSTQWAIQKLLSAMGLVPDAVVGHSAGEILAMAAAGIFPADRALENRLGELGSLFEAIEDGGGVPESNLVAVAADRTRVEALIDELGWRDRALLAIDNCPHQVVVAGPRELTEVFRARGLMAEELPFRRAYHTPKFREALDPVREFFNGMELHPPRIPIYSCASASPMPDSVDEIRRLAVEQWVQPVAFRQTIEALHAQGARIFVEVGARGSLTGYVEDILRGRPHFAVSANLPRRSGITQLNHLVASLYAQGLAIRPEFLYARRRPATVDLSQDLPTRDGSRGIPPTSTPRSRLSEGLVKRLRGGLEPLAHPLGSEALSGKIKPDSTQSVMPATPAERPGESALLDHFETMRRFLETQDAVMSAYLGSTQKPGPLPIGAVPEAPRVEPLTESRAALTIPPPTPTGEALDPAMVLLGLVSRRTGYPIETLSLDQDMEADLGIDSIKRVEIFGELQDQGMLAVGTDVEALSRARTLRDVIAKLRSPTDSGQASTSWPGEVVTFETGQRFVGYWILSPDDPVASHHTLGGRRISAVDTTRLGLPVLPFTVMAEILAQAAAILEPRRVVVGLQDVQAHRWIAYPLSGTSRIEATATRDPSSPDEISVSLRTVPAGPGQRPTLAVEGQVLFADRRPESPTAPPFQVDGGTPCRRTAEELYREQWLFHGEAFQAMTRVGDASRSAIEGTLRVLPRRALLPESRWPRLHTDPIVLDAFTHLLGCWGIDQRAGEEGDVMFPLRVGEIALFGEDPPEGVNVPCRITIDQISRPIIKARADLIGPSGRVWVSIRDWEDWRFYWPGHYRDVFRAPDTVLLGEPIDLSGTDPSLTAVWLEPPADMGKPVWRDVLARVQLSPVEHAESRTEGLSDREWTARIWSIVAAKEAARRLWLSIGGSPVFPADLSVDPDSKGRRLVGPVPGGRGEPPVSVAMASADGVAIAVASADVSARLGVGVIGLATFDSTPDPLDLPHAELSHVRIGESPELLAKIQCVRETAGRALRPREPLAWRSIKILSFVDTAGIATVTTDLEGDSPGPFLVRWGRRGEHVWAWTSLERTQA